MKLKGNLSPDRINEAVTQVLDFSEKNGLNRDGRVRLSVALEEILLEYRERYGESVPFQLVVLNRNGNIHVCLRVWCERLDPLRSGTDILRRVLSRMDDAPTWEYRSGYNQIDFTSAVSDRRSQPANQCGIVNRLSCPFCKDHRCLYAEYV